MSRLFEQVVEMHEHFGMKNSFYKMDPKLFVEFLRFRAKQMREEVDEFEEAVDEVDYEGMVDALVDNLVFTFGTLDVLNVGPGELRIVFGEVMDANFKKKVGVKTGRPNPYGLPDLLKPEGWQAPDAAWLGNRVRERLRDYGIFLEQEVTKEAA